MESHDTGSLITLVINSIICPFTFVLNVLVIIAVKKTQRLQTKANVLLACLAVTDVFTGFIAPPSFILWKALQFAGLPEKDHIGIFHSSLLRGLSICSALHLMLVTCERLIAIRFTYQHPYLVTARNIKVTVIGFWIISIFYVILGLIDVETEAVTLSFEFLAVLIVISCVIFIASAYTIMYREIRRHQKKIKNQQLPQGEEQRFARENKAFKTTVLVVGAVIVCFLPIALTVAVFMLFRIDTNTGVVGSQSCIPCPWVNTFIMLNSFINPLIYCRRQKEMRNYVFRFSCTSPVEPLANTSG